MIISVDHFGAIGDGRVDDAPALQAAINSAPDNATLTFPPGTYRIGHPIVVFGRSGLVFAGENATLTSRRQRIAGYFQLAAARRIHFEKLFFDQQQPWLPIYTRTDYGQTYNCAIAATDCESIAVHDCQFSNLYTSALLALRCAGIEVTNCDFQSPRQAQDQWLQHVHLQTCAGPIVIAGNRFANAPYENPAFGVCGVFASGIKGSITVRDNGFDYCGRDNSGNHRLGVVDFYGDVENVTVTDNVATNCMAQFGRISAARNVIFARNRIVVNAKAEYDYSTLTVESTIGFAPGIVGATNISITDNVFEDVRARAAFTVGAIAYDWGAPLRTIIVARNRFVGVRRSVYVAGPFSGVTIDANVIVGRPGGIEVVHTSPGNITAKRGSERAASFDGLRITNTVYDEPAMSGANAIVVNLSKSPRFAGRVGGLTISGNRLSTTSPTESAAIAVAIGAATPQGVLTIGNNKTTNFKTSLYIRGVRLVTGSRNHARGAGSRVLTEDGSNGSIVID
jgi:Pectate lyase superfamily protein